MDKSYPTVAESRAYLERAGWTIDDAAWITPNGLRWRVSGTRGKEAIKTEGASQAEAWYWACIRAGGREDAGPGKSTVIRLRTLAES